MAQLDLSILGTFSVTAADHPSRASISPKLGVTFVIKSR